MKKILLASILLTIGTSAFAASAPVALAAGSNTVAATACLLLSADVTATLSTSNIGNVSCNDTIANIGVAISNTAGKFKIYSLSSAGGAIATFTGTAATTATDVASKAASCSATACVSN